MAEIVEQVQEREAASVSKLARYIKTLLLVLIFFLI